MGLCIEDSHAVTMRSHYTLVLYPIKMSQKLVNLLLRLFVLAFVLLAESGSGSFNITRYTSGDIFQNINSSRSCNESGAKCVFDGKLKNSPFCGINCCFCTCNSQTPTYLQKNGNCSSEDRLMSILKVQSTIQGCNHRTVLGVDHFQCEKAVLTTLRPEVPGNNTMYLCPWKKGAGLIHFNLAKNLLRCEILSNESLYLFNGSWRGFTRNEQALSKLKVEIRPDPSFEGVNKLFLKWTTNFGKQYDGRILSLKLQCHGKQGKLLNSCVHFKKGGSLTDIMPTLMPSMKSTHVSNSSIQKNTPTEAATTTFVSVGKVSSSTTARVLIAGDTSLEDKPKKYNVVVIILAALAAALFVSLACVAVIFILWRRSRRGDMRKEAKNASNPVYERGASDTLKMASLTNRSGENDEEWPEYQPLVENTKSNERSDSLPGYRALSVGQKPTRETRSSNYLSLIKDDTEEGRNYQTLVKNVDPQVLQTVHEEKIPDYQELEERTDSEDSFDYSHHPSVDSSLDYEDPPLEAIMKKINASTPGKQKINDLSSDMHDYDEPGGVIVLSDHEDNQEQAIKDNIDFHDYADPDDTDEDNTKRHVIVGEDASCYHDYDDPAE